MDEKRLAELKEISRKIRVGIIDAVYSASSGHPGGSLSIADVLTYLYFEKMNIDPKNPECPDRDRLVLSKGHCAPGLYSAFAHRGYFPVEDLKTFRKTSSYLQGPRYEAHSRRRYVVRFSRTGRVSLVRNGSELP